MSDENFESPEMPDMSAMPTIDIGFSESMEGKLEEEPIETVLSEFMDELGMTGKMLTVHFADDAEVRELNKEHRGKDKTTDVLSWSYYEDDHDSPALGDLVVSLEQAARQAEENGWDLFTETVRLLAHGCAHLIGLDHERSEEEERKMLTLEVQMLNRVGLPHLYPEPATGSE